MTLILAPMEGLLDHTAVRATEPVLGLKGTRSKEPEIALAKLESLLAQGQDKLIDFLDHSARRGFIPKAQRDLLRVEHAADALLDRIARLARGPQHHEDYREI